MKLTLKSMQIISQALCGWFEIFLYNSLTQKENQLHLKSIWRKLLGTKKDSLKLLRWKIELED